jgi:small-conductance mechanosensitive channel
MNPQLTDEFLRRIGSDAAAFAPRGVTAVLLVAGFHLAGRLASGLMKRLGAARAVDTDLIRLLARSARVAALAFGVVTALGTLGVDVNALVAGLGLTGFALGFALRDIIANTLAGILILVYKPFRRGDHLTVAGSDGVITAIDLRYTVLTVDDATRVLVPNQTLFTNSIKVSAATRGAPSR